MIFAAGSAPADEGRTAFNATTGTPLAGLHHKERFFQQGDCLALGMTVREAAAETRPITNRVDGARAARA